MFWMLTALTTVCILYCIDEPIIWHGFSFLINDHNSMLYGIGLSIIAAYIFFVFQTWIPQKCQENKAYRVLEKRIKKYIDHAYWVMTFCESLCEINRKDNVIKVKSNYARYLMNGIESKFIVKIDIRNYVKGSIKLKDQITGNGHYMQLEKKKISAFQNLVDNNFLIHFNRYINNKYQINHVELIKEYDEFKVFVHEARKIFKINDTLSLTEYSDEDRIREFESKIFSPDDIEEGLTAIWYMKIED